MPKETYVNGSSMGLEQNLPIDCSHDIFEMLYS